MDALAAYQSESEEEVPSVPTSSGARVPVTDAQSESESESESEVDPKDAFGLQHAVSSTSNAPTSTALVSATAAPVVAEKQEALDVQPTTQSVAPGGTKTLTGYVEETAISDFDFRNQQRTFDVLGYARNPSAYAAGTSATNAQAFVGDHEAAHQMQGATLADLRGGTADTRRQSRAMRRKRKGRMGDASIVDGEGAYVGPWGGWDDEVAPRAFEPAPATDMGPTPEELEAAKQAAEKRKREASEYERRRQMDESHGTEKSIFHGESLYDYQGRTYMHIPTDTDVNLRGEPGDTESFLPEMCIHTFTGHNKGITALRLFPQSGHLMLSASMDTKIKLWDVYHEGRCLRTFLGHSNAVRDVTFTNDGRQFLSAGYDCQVKLWDTETGACLQAVSFDDVPLCVRFNPDADKQHIFLAGTNDKRIVQYDLREQQITQEYNQHQGPVNTVTFVDMNRRFISTSDDKSLRAWDWDIPVPIKLVADPLMHSMPSATLHPSQRWLACQGMNNTISVYSTDTFKPRKKTFRGHTTAGFACQIGFSPDGRFMSSGDSQGDLVFWDWKNGKELKRLSTHKDVVIAHEWLPHETSKIVTGAWDGLIKLWT
ncbi:catalytic step 2 spliceosome protein [Malassezia pachydermatis]